MNPASLLLLILWIYAALFLLVLLRDIRIHRKEPGIGKTARYAVIGFLASFLGPLGIGSFPIAASGWKITKAESDDLLPGTLHVALAIPAAAEATLFLRQTDMDIPTLLLLAASSVIGASAGAGALSKLPLPATRALTGMALAVTAALTLCRLNALGPFGLIGKADSLSGTLLIAAAAGNLIFGALAAAGVGLPAPCMALFLVLGMRADAAFPVAVSSYAFLAPSAAIAFIREGRYCRRAVIPMIPAGLCGALAIGLFPIHIPHTLLSYLICVTMLLCAGAFLHEAMPPTPEKHEPDA